ncbi:MAG: DUF4248 domain-containing protein, partial [Prevotellaceae bacterium]|nr:DUF4248 domain-containing protein [Prevotellaceae bacterium]
MKSMPPFNPSDPDARVPVRTYTKDELARLYNPHLSPASATQLLRRWIAHNSQLTTRLAEAGYAKNRHSYTPREVRLIFE